MHINRGVLYATVGSFFFLSTLVFAQSDITTFDYSDADLPTMDLPVMTIVADVCQGRPDGPFKRKDGRVAQCKNGVSVGNKPDPSGSPVSIAGGTGSPTNDMTPNLDFNPDRRHGSNGGGSGGGSDGRTGNGSGGGSDGVITLIDLKDLNLGSGGGSGFGKGIGSGNATGGGSGGDSIGVSGSISGNPSSATGSATGNGSGSGTGTGSGSGNATGGATGGGSGNGTGTGNGADSATGKATDNPATPRGCGYMKDGAWIETDCHAEPAPDAPQPEQPNIPEHIQKAINDWRNRWVKFFEDMGKAANDSLKKLEWDLRQCALNYGEGTPLYKKCSELSIKNHKDNMKRIKERIAQGKVQMKVELEPIHTLIDATATVPNPRPNYDKPSEAGENTSGGNSVTNNTTNTNNTTTNNTNTTSTSTTTNHITNNISSGTTGSASGGKTSASGNHSGSAIGSGQENEKEQGKDKGETMTEFCEKNPRVLQCIEIGDADSSDSELDKGLDELVSTLKKNGQSNLPKFDFKKYLSASATCPPPMHFSVYGKTASISYQYACDFLAKIRGIVVILAVFLTTFMVLKGVRS